MSDPHDAHAREEMLRTQLRRRGIHDPGTLRAMGRVPRERFIADSIRDLAYDDRALSIDCGQTISQPFIVGLMTQALELSGGEKVLEIGTGSGYQTAVLAELCHEVVTIERHANLSRRAELLLAELGYGNVTFLYGDGSLGWPARAPYDRVIVTAAAERCPEPLLDQLADGGILVIPVGPRDGQVLQAIRKSPGKLTVAALSQCRFVPLIASGGKTEAL